MLVVETGCKNTHTKTRIHVKSEISHDKKCPTGKGQGVRLARNEEVLT